MRAPETRATQERRWRSNTPRCGFMSAMHSVFALAAVAADIAVFSAAGDARVQTIQPPGGGRFLVDPCWVSPTTLVTLNEGPPALLQRREFGGAPVTVRRVPRMVDGSIAPGCDTVAFLRSGRKGYDVWLRRGNARAQRVVRTSSHWEQRPRFSWTPDARRVAFAPRSSDARLRVVDVTSGRVLRGFSLRAVGGADWLSPQALSPDGRFVVFGGNGVRMANVRTGKVRMLYRDGSSPSVSRRGDRVAVRTRAGVKVLDLNGRTLLNIPGTDGEHLVWSPDDTRIAATAGGAGEVAVDVIDLTTTPPRVERRLPTSSHFRSPPVWSTDGTQLAIERTPF